MLLLEDFLAVLHVILLSILVLLGSLADFKIFRLVFFIKKIHHVKFSNIEITKKKVFLIKNSN